MKKTFLLLIVVSLLFASCKKKEVVYPKVEMVNIRLKRVIAIADTNFVNTQTEDAFIVQVKCLFLGQIGQHTNGFFLKTQFINGRTRDSYNTEKMVLSESTKDIGKPFKFELILDRVVLQDFVVFIDNKLIDLDECTLTEIGTTKKIYSYIYE